MDYRVYQCNGKDTLLCLVISVGIGLLTAWLFYHSWYALLFVVPIYFSYRRSYKRERMERRRSRLLLEFKDGMQAVSAALLAGYSMENAWRESEIELTKLYGEEAMLAKEFHQINVEVGMNQPLEQQLAAFALRSGCEDIEDFSEVFSFAKRSGGDFGGIIQKTIQKMGERMEVEEEIATMIAGKKLEGKIMSMMPMMILAYLNLTSEEFLKPLYGNALGQIVMTGVLIAYAGAIKLAERIVDIKV